MLGSGGNSTRESTVMPPLTQCLPLEPITLGNQKHTRSGELRRALGVPFGSTGQDSSFRATHSKPSKPVAAEELKHIKSSVQDSSNIARNRVKLLHENIFKLDTYKDTLSSKKRHRSEAKLTKMGSQIHRSSCDITPQRLEERPKSLGLNKRARTFVVDGEASGRPSAISRHQMAEEKDGDMLHTGDDGWDKKIKKKRSVGAVGNRVMNADRDVKRAMHPKMIADSMLRSGDAQSFRLKSMAGVGGINRLEGSSEPSTSNASTVFRTEPEIVPLSRDRTTMLEHKVAKGKNKSNIWDDNPARSSSTQIKANISRAPHTGSAMVLNSSPNVETSGEVNNPKNLIPTDPSSHSIARWVGQRPHNKSRMRRSNLASPVTDHVETHIAPVGAVLSNSSVGKNTPKFKRKLVNVSSSVGLSEDEESGDGEERFRRKGTCSGQIATSAAHKVGTFALPVRKNQVPTSGRTSSVTRPGIPPGRENLENLPTTKPFQRARPGSDKSKSKYGRPPSKKPKDQKAASRVGTTPNAGSSVYAVESDDHEELYAAKSSALNARDLACSGPFWKKMEHVFASVSSEDTSYLKQQLSFAKELDDDLSAVFGVEYKELAGTDASRGRSDDSKLDKVTPLYQRVLSALIEEDETEEFYGEGKSMSLRFVSDGSHSGSCNHIDDESKERDRMESEVESRRDLLRSSGTPNSLHSDEKWQKKDVFSHSDMELVSDVHDLGESNISGLSSSDSQYQLMCLDDRLLLELQSIGLYPETLPDLAEEEMINQDIMELKEMLSQQVGRKKKKLEKVDKAIQDRRDEEKRNKEQVAMDQLVEIAYRKRLACRGSNASKGAARQASRQNALAFIKRTLVRCRKFDNTGISCFREPPLQDLVFAAPPPYSNDSKSADCVGSGTASNTYNEVSNHQEEARGSGAVSSTPKGHGSHQGVVGGASSRITSSSSPGSDVGGETKGKRSKRGRRPSSSIDGFKGERRTEAKAKPEQKDDLHRVSGDSSKAPEETFDPVNKELHELDPIELGGAQDLNSWLDFEEDGLADLDCMGLDIPMDDLSDLMLM